MGQKWGILLSVVILSTTIFAENVKKFPKHIENDTALIQQVQSGKPYSDESQSTPQEFVLKVYAVFEKPNGLVTANDFINLVTTYEKYSSFFPNDVKRGLTTFTSPDKNEYKYSLWILANGLTIRVNGEQKITRAKDATSEAYLENKFTNQMLEKYFSSIGDVATIYPYGTNAILVEDILKMKKTGANNLTANEIQKKLASNLPTFIKKFQEELTK